MGTAVTLRFNGAVSVEVGPHKDLHLATNASKQQGTENNGLQPKSEAQDQDVGEECALDLLSGTEERQEDIPEDGLGEEEDRLGEKDHCENSQPDIRLSQALNN